MSVEQLPARVREFVNYLDGLLARLDQGGGWCGVFWQRDPEGMQACLDGREVPPWDVVESLLHDLAAQYGPGGAGPETERARTLHAAALAAYDARPGGRDALGDRLDVMLREQRYAGERLAELGRSIASATSQEEADAIRLDLAWARDDHERATARCAELRSRIADLGRRAARERGQAIRRERAGQGAAFRLDGRFGDEEFGDDGTGGEGAQPSEYGSYGAGFRGVTHQRDERPAAGWSEGRAEDPAGAPGWFEGRETATAGGPGWSEGREAAPAGTAADPRRGQRAVASAAEAGVWRAARRGSGAGAAEHPDAHPADPVDSHAPGSAASDWPQAHPTPAATTPDAPAQAPSATPEPAPTAKQRKRRRGSARFAGIVEEEAAPVVVPPTAEPVLPTLPAQPVTSRRTPRGARFAGAADEAPVVPDPQPQVEPAGAVDRREVVGTVETLVRLRGEGRSGEAHALLVEVAYWPAVRIPLLAAEMERAGLGADWATLLWEAASLPAEQLVAAADALTAAGRADDGEQILRQGVARPAHEIGQAVVGLAGEARHREVRALLDAYVRVRTPEEAARSVAPDPKTLVPLLLQAAQGVSDECYWDLVHALRVAGFTA
ncbi:hypothetical protein [Streptomyces bicolor]|uniref:hypothetical protein n=1 Tax=Streptomyces bicolor TaxID=66874 RepID=UPI0004E1DDD2|nr:hypothetical protein [Streptomyces bicolor]